MWVNKLLGLAWLLFALPLAGYGAPSPIPAKSVEIHLEPDVKVGGEQVVLGDVATIYSKSLQDFHALSSLVISKIPDDKQEVRLPRSYLESRIRAALPAGMDFSLHAPAEIVFRLQRLGLKGQDLANEIARMGRAAGKIPEGVEVEVLPLSGTEQLVGYSLSTTRIEPFAEMERWKGDLTFKLTRTDGVGNGQPIWVRAKVRWFQQVWVASRSLSYSEQIDPASFGLARVETTALREEPIAGNLEQLSGILRNARMRRSLAANSPLLPSAFERRPDAQAGSSMRVIFVSEGGVRVTADGLLMGAGLIGGEVKARMRSSKKVVTGKLVSQNVVEVSL